MIIIKWIIDMNGRGVAIEKESEADRTEPLRQVVHCAFTNGTEFG